MDAAEVRRLFKYDRWANRQVAEALAKSVSAPPKSVKWMAHIVGSEAMWLARLTRQTAPLPIWPEFLAADLLRELDVVDRAWQQFVDGLHDVTVGSTCEYANSKGELFASAVGDLLTHVVMHSAYHRGQIAADMRAAGLEPVYTDFIHAARQGYIG
jgi:uncharacterized damage-inducible protein DinB